MRTIRMSCFPTDCTVKDIKSLLENHTGEGSVTAIEKKGHMFSVQFIDSSYAEKILDVFNANELQYNRYCLKAWKCDTDITPHRIFWGEMDDITMDFGCQKSGQIFAVLKEATKVSVKFETRIEKIHFYLSHDADEYWLQLSRKNIWQIVLHSSCQTKKLLLIKLSGAPRIYKKLHSSDCFYVDTPYYKWVRTIDFTPSLIGQSSAFCLQIPQDMKVPDFETEFENYCESETPLSLEDGLPFCVNQPLVPIVQNSFLPYKILFKICNLVHSGHLSGLNLNNDFFNLVDPKKYNAAYIEHALEELYKLKECCYDPVPWLEEKYCKYRLCLEEPKPSIGLRDGLVYVHRVLVTPTRVHFSVPEVNMSNSVLRHYIDHIDNFIRVSFVDEEWNKIHSSDLSQRGFGVGNEKTSLHEWIILTLRNGIKIGDKLFEFLAYSNSQLKDNSLWMFAATDNIDANGIRKWMGDFSSIRNVAKYAARLGQSFASSIKTLSVDKDEFEIIPDVEMEVGGTKYIFSDGIGKISVDFARSVAERCGIRGSTPSAFQIRYGGFKGVVAVDPNSSKKLSLRGSMLKFHSDNTELDVLSWSKYQPGFLNRQIITLLSTLGVSDNVFERKQSEAVAHMDGVLKDTNKAQEALYMLSPGESIDILKELLNCGYKPDEEPFLSMMLQSFCSSMMLGFKKKTRIFIPKAQQMMGCLDETGNLNHGQVFVQLSQAPRSFNKESTMFDDNTSTDLKIITGKVVVAKNPCLHPGDVRILEAVNVQQLHHMVDCVVFPQKGIRPHPNECSGSDLDGDIYFVCWDKELIPPNQVEAMAYNPSPNIDLNRDVRIEDLMDFFANYGLNKKLRIISNAHASLADTEEGMAASVRCTELAKLFSIEVDFPKTGYCEDIPRDLIVKKFPDFMEIKYKESYESQRILGKLYRQAKGILPQESKLSPFTKEVAKTSYDEALEVEGFENYIPHAVDYKRKYDYKLRNLMAKFSIETEAQLLSVEIIKMSDAFDRSINKEAIGEAVRVLREETRSWFEYCCEKGVDEEAMASAWYHVTYNESFWGYTNEGMNNNVGMNMDHYISFPWCVYEKLASIKRKAHATRLRRGLSLR